MERMTRFRSAVLLGIFGFVMFLFATKLFSLQIIETKGNTDNATTYSTITTVRAARGDILDRNGNVLVGNRASYDLVFNHYVIKSADQRNQYLYDLLKKCEELGVTHNDHFPVTATRPFEYTLDSYNTSWQGYYQSFMVDWGLDPDITAPLLVERMRERYELPEEWTDEEARGVIGLRYEFDLRGVTNLPNYVFIEDVSNENLSAILELNTPGLMVESSTVREYHTSYAAHILGYMGGMDSDDWAKYKDQGYSMDAYIGQSGFEEAFEEYLHGIDGSRLDVVSKDGAIVRQEYLPGKEPIAGNNVETTIDITLQKIAEDSLSEVMHNFTDPEINTAEGENTGLDAEGAAVIVMKVKTGEILACASYPTFDLANIADKATWDAIMEDPLKPFFNRAFGANYAPGSTYKMCTLVSAMEHTNSRGERILNYMETIQDKGVFTELEGFNPKCLLFSSVQATHGTIDATDALKVSCNYFFYELGYRLTWQMLDETAKGFGLGEPTGIELTEKIGWRANPDSKAASYTGPDSVWNAGDRVLTAIGQSENRFSPLQLCVYACTLANRGTRYRATFLNRVASSDYRTLIKQNEPEIVSKMDISYDTYEMYMTGMRKVITDIGGTANKYFGGHETLKTFPVAVCAKTGTAQHSSGGSDHGAFICFAPMEDPEIAVAIYGEKVAHGSSLAPVAEQILEAYFEMEAASDVFTYENQVG
ncbi:MAG: penicillin-binding transpeptidase domain-containing protein [Firmicutes bacterium]|nr:penicillin-binding transpeptidase domain-containing protein [Bacillota bacterium]MDY6160829.1 penicillin-binding transpeptidase domain-containing protein [Candidatus Faecousia sp.]